MSVKERGRDIERIREREREGIRERNIGNKREG